MVGKYDKLFTALAVTRLIFLAASVLRVKRRRKCWIGTSYKIAGVKDDYSITAPACLYDILVKASATLYSMHNAIHFTVSCQIKRHTVTVTHSLLISAVRDCSLYTTEDFAHIA